MKKWRKLALLVPLAVVIIAMFTSQTKNLTCQVNYREDLAIKINSHTIKTEKTRTLDERIKGLGGRSCINPNQAMLFEFEKSGYYPFWMRDMKFPIDIVWINKNHQAVTVKPNIMPDTYPQTFTNDSPAQFVLELKAGQTSDLGIKYGTKLDF